MKLTPRNDDLPEVRTQTREVTYHGSRCLVTETLHSRKPLGLRTVRFEWLDDAHVRNGGYLAGTVVVRLIEGDGRMPNFVIHDEWINDRGPDPVEEV